MKKVEIRNGKGAIYLHNYHLKYIWCFGKDLGKSFLWNPLCLFVAFMVILRGLGTTIIWEINTTIYFSWWSLVLMYFILIFALVSFSKKRQPQFIFLQFEAGSDINKLELNNVVLLREIKLNHVNTKATRVYSFVKKTNIQLPSSLIAIFKSLISLAKIHLFVQVFFG